jgi:hypothetical protein
MGSTIALALVAAALGCAENPTADSLTATAPQSAAADVSLPTCSGPQVKPDWWTPDCGDAGYQLELTWESWTSDAARAHGTTRIVHGSPAGRTWSMRVVFDQPRRVASAGSRTLFSRAVVSYTSGVGPQGSNRDTFDLADVWQQAAEIAAQPVDPCTTDSDGVSNCASMDPAEMADSPAPSG